MLIVSATIDCCTAIINRSLAVYAASMHICRSVSKHTVPYGMESRSWGVINEVVGAGKRYGGYLQSNEVGSVLGAVEASDGKRARSRHLVWLVVAREHRHGEWCQLLD